MRTSTPLLPMMNEGGERAMSIGRLSRKLRACEMAVEQAALRQLVE